VHALYGEQVMPIIPW